MCVNPVAEGVFSFLGEGGGRDMEVGGKEEGLGECEERTLLVLSSS